MRTRHMALILTLFLSLSAARGNAQMPRAGSEFQINSYTSDFQSYPAIAADDQGRFVVVWSSYGQDYYYGGIFAQRLSNRGRPLGSEFKVNTQVFDDQYLPDVGAAPNGSFVVAWGSYYQDGEDLGTFAQRYNSDGSPAGTEFQVNTYTSDAQDAAQVRLDARGNFVVVWEDETLDGDDFGVFAKRFDSSGAPNGTEFQVNTTTLNYQGAPGLAVASDGSFVIVWTSDNVDGGGYAVAAQNFASDGRRVGSEFRVNTFTTGDQFAASVARTGNGFVVAWETPLQDRDAEGVFAQRIGSAGLIGSEFQVNTYRTGNQGLAAVASDANGNFTVVWSSTGQDGDLEGVFGANFSSTGAPIGTEFQINSDTFDSQTYPAVAMSPDGSFLVAWASSVQDEDGFGVFGQRFSNLTGPATCVGDCSADQAVTVDELIKGVNIALGSQPLSACTVFDTNNDQMVAVNELILGVNAALNGCPS